MSAATTTTTIPPLVHGERLTREEFHRRYLAMPELKKAQLVEGVVYMPTRVRAMSHAVPHAHLGGWLGMYKVATPGVEAGSGPTVILDDENEPEPDVVMFIRPPHAAQARVNADDFLEGPPDFVAEVTDSTERVDMGAKFRVYQRVGVREYLVWRTEERELLWHVLRDGHYERLMSQDGLLKSEAFPGLWLDAAALLAGDLTRVLAALQRGVATPEHAAFVRSLAGGGSGMMSPT